MSDSSEPQLKKPKLRVKQATSSSSKKRSRKPTRKRHKRSPNSLDHAARILLGICATLTPWLYGSISAWALLGVSILLAATLVIWLIRNLSRHDNSRINVLVIPLLLFLGLGFVQILPLPGALSNRVAKKQNSIRASVAKTLEVNHEDLAESIRANNAVSLNPTATKHELSYFLLLGIAFIASSRFFFSRNDSIKLAVAMMINGCVLSVFGTFQKVAYENSIYGIPLEFGGVPFASFVNRNNAAGYLLICLGATIAVILYSFARIQQKESVQKSTLKTTSVQKGMKEVRVIFANLTTWRITILLICGLITAAIAITLSRGGTIAAVVGIIATILFLFRHKRTRSIFVLLIFFLPLSGGALLWSGLQVDVGDRLSTLENEEILSDEIRVQLWSDNLNALKDYPYLGSGLGTYRYVYKEYQSFADGSWFYHGENVFVELLVIAGILGVVLLAILVIGIIYIAAKLPRKRGNPLGLGIGTAGFFILVSQSIANFFDFGMFIPSNGLAFVIFLGALVGTSNIQKGGKRANEKFYGFLPKWTKWPVVAILIFFVAFSAQSFWKLRSTESAVRLAQTTDTKALTLEEIDQDIERLESAVETESTLEAHEYLTELYLLKFQNQYVDHLLDTPEGKNFDRDTVWNGNSIRMLNIKLGSSPAEIRKQSLATLSDLELFEETIPKAYEHCERALEVCPLSVRSIIRLGELAYLMEKPVEPYLVAVENFNVRNASYFLRIGNVAAVHRIENIAFSNWKQAMLQQPNSYSQIIPIAGEFFDSENICKDLIPDDAKMLVNVADRFLQKDKDEYYRRILFGRVRSILTSGLVDSAEEFYLLGRAFAGLGEQDEAVEYIERATRLDPLNIVWKLQLAAICFELGKIEKGNKLVEECETIDKSNVKLIQLKKSRGL